MPLSEAKVLLQAKPFRQPQPAAATAATAVYLLEQDPTADQRALEQLADTLSGFSPLIGVEQVPTRGGAQPKTRSAALAGSVPDSQPAAVFFDLSGVERLYGNEHYWGEQLYQAVEGRRYLPRLAIADTLAIAWGVSHFGTANWRIVPAGDQSLFGQLPLPALRLSAGTVELLQRLGIETIGQLWEIPRNELGLRLGEEVLIRIDQARGSLAEPFSLRRPPHDFSSRQIPDYPTTNQNQLLRIIQQLLEAICQQLKSNQQGGLQWSLRLLLIDAPPITLFLDLFQPSADPAEILPLIEMKLEQEWSRGFAAGKEQGQSPAVSEIEIRATHTGLMVARQRQLFDESPRLDQQGLAQLINRLANRLGADQVLTARLNSGAQPELSYRWQPLVGSHAPRKSGSPRSQSHIAGQPLRIFRPATPLQINQWNIRQWWGPERIETGWWRGATVCRNYWRVETVSGQHFWIYQDLRSQQWYLHGEF
jgi:protein ImuB